MGATPRRASSSGETEQLWATLREVLAAVGRLERATTLRDASISGGQGLRIYEESSEIVDELTGPAVPRLWIAPDGTITVYDDGGSAAVRFGKMLDTVNEPGADAYGIEVNVAGDWVQLGTQVVAWDNVGGKPAEYDAGSRRWTPRPHRHPGDEIDGAVGTANRSDTTRLADDALHAALADGSRWAFDNTVTGTQFYAVWVGNDGGFHLGRNVSSRKYKENIQPWEGDPKAVLDVELVRFDRKPQPRQPAVGIGPPSLPVDVSRGEFGVIAEQSHEHVPEVTQWYDGEIDGVRYEMYGVLLIPVVKDHEQRISQLEEENAELRRRMDALEKLVTGKGGTTR